MKWDVFSKGKLEVFVIAQFLGRTKKNANLKEWVYFLKQSAQKAFLSKEKGTFGQPLKMDRKGTRKNNKEKP